MRTRRVSEKVSVKFLIDLLAPFHPKIKPNEEIVDLDFEEGGVVTYHIIIH